MNKIKFFKYQGLGNDFILINDFDNQISKNEKFIIFLCNRHFGIGADGIIYVQRKGNNYFMKIFNSDGSEAEMCGNGIRCIAKYLFDFGCVKEKKFEIGTLAGTKTVEVKTNKGKTETVIVEMGKPLFLGNANIEGENLRLVSMGNPHAIAFKEKLDINEIKERGPKIENDKYFPNKTNVEFARVKNKNEIELIVWERGAGITLACGTGACAVVAAAAKENLIKINRPITVQLPGGKLEVMLKNDFSKIWMSGPAKFVFEGIL